MERYGGGQTRPVRGTHAFSMNGSEFDAVMAFGPGMLFSEPVGVACRGCDRDVEPGQHGFVVSGPSPHAEVWHRDCYLETAELDEPIEVGALSR
ncbi:MAG: hypothetical protein E6I33_08960 [Chloroflexi bacterium]|nr:MAG: hypothetical protein E6I33_08960 [Chloroflexota bacterium]